MTLHSGPEPSLALTLLLPERQRVSPRCWGVGGAESCASPTPPSALAAPPPPSEGQGLLRLSWLGLDAISAAEQGSLAGSNFLIRTPGLPARLLVLSPYSPPAKPHPTGLPTDHSHAQGTTRVQVGGATVGSPQWDRVQERCWCKVPPPLLRGPRSRSRLLTQLLDACFRLLHPPCLPPRVDPQPQEREGRLG